VEDIGAVWYCVVRNGAKPAFAVLEMDEGDGIVNFFSRSELPIVFHFGMMAE
jgi:hypothetical protein